MSAGFDSRLSLLYPGQRSWCKCCWLHLERDNNKLTYHSHLVPVQHPSGGNSRIVAVDPKGTGHHLITCTYPNTLPRVFIGDDFALGPLALIDKKVHNTVHNQVPKWCATIPFTNGEKGVA